MALIFLSNIKKKEKIYYAFGYKLSNIILIIHSPIVFLIISHYTLYTHTHTHTQIHTIFSLINIYIIYIFVTCPLRHY